MKGLYKKRESEIYPNMNKVGSKIFVDRMYGAIGKEIIAFSLSSGEDETNFVTTPLVFKSMAKWMNKQVENYEIKFGEIENIDY